jgi:glycosyltransferase involved in cell wall biosynthesis
MSGYRSVPMSDDLPDVCVVTHPLSAAGENATRTLLEILAALTSMSLVTADLPTDSAIRDRHEVHEVSTQSAGDSILVALWRFLRNQVRMARLVRRRQEPVVLFFGATSYLLPVVAARAAGKTVVLEPRGDVPLTLRLAWERRVPGPVARLLASSLWTLERLCYHLSSAIVTYTPAMAAELGLEGFAEKLFTNGARYVDTEAFAPRVPYDERNGVVGFVGRLDEEKCVRQLGEAAREFPPGTTLRFVGDGPVRAELERDLADLLEAGRVEFAEWVDHDEVPAELASMRLLVLPSQPTEGLPTTILEAMACGTPALASPVAGVPDVVRPGETGFTLEGRAPEQIARAVRRVLDRDDLDEISANARRLVETEYSFDAAVGRYREILQALDGRADGQRD